MLPGGHAVRTSSIVRRTAPVEIQRGSSSLDHGGHLPERRVSGRLYPIHLDRVRAGPVDDDDREFDVAVAVDVRVSEDPTSREAIDRTEDLWLRSGAEIPNVETEICVPAVELRAGSPRRAASEEVDGPTRGIRKQIGEARRVTGRERDTGDRGRHGRLRLQGRRGGRRRSGLDRGPTVCK